MTSANSLPISYAGIRCRCAAASRWSPASAGAPGIGYAIARRLAGLGASLVIHHYAPHDRDQPWGADPGGPEAVIGGVTEALADPDAAVWHHEADLSDPDSPARLVESAAATSRFLDILVCNHARSGGDGPLGTVTADMLDAHWAVNTRASIRLAQAFAAAARQQPAAALIVFMTSGQDLGPMTGEVAYAASKGALASITRTLADQLADRGITVNTVNPGPVDTGYAAFGPAGRARDRPPPFPAGPLGHPRRPGPPDRLAGHRRGRLDHRPGHQLRGRLPPLGLTRTRQLTGCLVWPACGHPWSACSPGASR